MRSRAIQLVLIIGIGALIGWLVTRDWHARAASEPAPVPGPAVAETLAPGGDKVRIASVTHSAASAAESPARMSAAAAPAITFKLPAMTPPIAPPAKREAPPKPPLGPPQMVPADWLLRGSAPSNYDLRSDRVQVWAGTASALLVSHDKNVHPGQFGSILQEASAAPYLGKRVEFSVSVRAEDRGSGWEVWFSAIDAGRVVIVRQMTNGFARNDQWARHRVVVDVPWSADAVAYGVSLQGKGSLWIDDARIDVVDTSLPTVGYTLPNQIGVRAQVAAADGPLPAPSNMDFERLVPLEASARDAPADAIDARRF